MKRQRGRGRKPGGGHHNHHNQPNRTMESNGPDTKVRGPAAHIYERYLQLARDAASSGDRVLSENYMQHADHYFRLVRLMQPAAPPQPERLGAEQDFEAEEEGAPEAAAGEDGEAAAGEAGEQPDVDFPQGQQPQQFARDGEHRRRRGRRNRFRPGGEGEAGEGEDREAQRDRGDAEGRDRRDRPPRERDSEREQPGPEGFSDGPKPAFLRGD